MKKLILLLLMVMSVTMMLKAQKFTYTYKGNELEYTIQAADPKTVYVSKLLLEYDEEKYDDELGIMPVNLIVPSTVTHEGQEYAVAGIAVKAFWQDREIVSVVLPEGIKEICKDSFTRCVNLKQIQLPETLETISDNSFYECSGLQQISIPNTVKIIGNNAFYGCRGLQKVEYASMESLLYMSIYSPNPLYYAHKLFIDGEYISDLVIPDDVTEIGDCLFSGGDFATITLSRGLKSIGNQTFRNCPNIKSITIPNTVVRIGNNAFYESRLETIILEEGSIPMTVGYLSFPNIGLKTLYVGRPHTSPLLQKQTTLENLTLGNCVQEVLDREFSDFVNIKELTLGSNLQTIGEHAFDGCKGLTKVVIPPGVTHIKEWAFANTGIANIVIGYGIRGIESYAFSGAPVASFDITTQNIPAVGENVFSNFDFTFRVEGEEAQRKFAESSNFWNRLKSELLVKPTYVRYDGPIVINGIEDESFKFTASVRPEEVSLPYVFWNTTDPTVATVTTDGLVTLQPGVTQAVDGAKYYIMVNSIYTNTEDAHSLINYTGVSGIEEIREPDLKSSECIDYTLPYTVYGLDGRKIEERTGVSTEGLAKGIYILRQGDAVKKVVVN